MKKFANLRHVLKDKYHAQQTVSFIEDLLLNIEGTIEEKIVFLSKIKEEVPKFHGRK